MLLSTLYNEVLDDSVDGSAIQGSLAEILPTSTDERFATLSTRLLVPCLALLEKKREYSNSSHEGICYMRAI